VANCTLASGEHQYLTHDVSMFQGSSRFKISGGTFNAFAGDQITHIYSGELVLQIASAIEARVLITALHFF
jgi:hypothetical protein